MRINWLRNESTRPISTGLSEISETSHEPNSTQESESLDLADIESRDVTQYDDDSDRMGSNPMLLELLPVVVSI